MERTASEGPRSEFRVATPQVLSRPQSSTNSRAESQVNTPPVLSRPHSTDTVRQSKFPVSFSSQISPTPLLRPTVGTKSSSPMADVQGIPMDKHGRALSGNALMAWLARSVSSARVTAGLQPSEELNTEGRPVGPDGQPLAGDSLTHWLIRQWMETQKPSASSPVVVSSSTKVSAKDIGYFHPQYIKSGESRPTTDFIVEVGEAVYYTSVAAFCDRIQDMIVPHGPAVIKQQLVQCLRGESASWYSQELDITEKMTIRDDQSSNLIQFCTKLKKRFKVNKSDALDRFYGSFYSPYDAQAGRHLRTFVNTKHIQGREADIPTEQLTLLIHNMIDPVFQVCMMEVDDTTSFQEYRDHCSIKGDLFLRMYKASASNRSQSAFTQRRGYGADMLKPANGSAALPAIRGEARPYTYRNDGIDPSTKTFPRSMNGAAKQVMGPDGKMYANPQGLSRPCRHCAASNVVAFHKDPECPRLASAKRPVAAHWNYEEDQFLLAPEENYHSREDLAPTVETHFNLEVPQFSYEEDQTESAFHSSPGGSPGPKLTAKTSLKQITGTISCEALLSDADGDSQESLSDETTVEHGDSIYNSHSESIVNHTLHPPIKSQCNVCAKHFPSRSAMFQHLRTDNCRQKPPPDTSSFHVRDNWVILESTSTPCPGLGWQFKDYEYAKIKTRFDPDGPDNTSCLDTGTAFSSIDKRLVLPWMRVQELSEPITITGIGGISNKSSEFTVLSIYLPNNKGQLIKLAPREFHLVDQLDCGMLLGNDLCFNEGFVIDEAAQLVTVHSTKDPDGSQATVPITVVRPKPTSIIEERIFIEETVAIPPLTVSFVKTKATKVLAEGVSYEFVPKPVSLGASGVECLFDSTSTGILFRNRSNVIVELRKDSEIGLCVRAMDRVMDVPSHFTPLFMTLAEQGITLEQGESSDTHIKVKLCDDVKKEADLVGNDMSRMFKNAAGKPFGSGHVTVNTHEITKAQHEALRKVVQDHEALFSELLGQVKEPPEEWLEIPIKPGEDLKSPGVYKVSERDKKEIDKTFDALRSQGLLEPGKGPVGWPVFVVWKNGKGRVVVDLRGLNAATVADAYPLPNQEEIMSLLKDCVWITCIDVRSSFYQRLVKLFDRYKLTIVSHRGQEMFGVAVMGFCNSAAHCQRLYDRVLPSDYSKCYIDDIVVFSKTFEEHLKHLEEVFSILEKLGITLAPEKCFVGFHSVELLGHVVDRFGLYTQEQKVKAILDIQFPENLQQLENFIGITGYYRHFCERYARLIRPLQDRKTLLLKPAPTKKQARKQYCIRTRILEATKAERESFRLVKEGICAKTVLIHHDSSVPVLYRMDASYEDGFACAIMQVPRSSMEAASITAEDICAQKYNRKLERPLMFISRELSAAEHNYWPTELETQCCVWSIQKTRQIVEQNKNVIVFTDHQAIVAISKMKALKTQSIDRSNKKLIRASQFLSQYPHIDIRHVSGESNVGPDRLSRLKKVEGPVPEHVLRLKERRAAFYDDEDVDTDYLFMSTISYVSSDLKTRIALGYEADPYYQSDFKRYKCLLDEARKENASCNQIESAQFVYRQEGHEPGLIYMEDPFDKRLRLCLPRNVWLDVFHEAHDNLNHANVDRAIRVLRQDYFIKNMHSELKKYCETCPSCDVNSTKRHAPYGLLQPIKTPSVIWQVITMDFVVKLPVSKLLEFSYDSFLTVTDKFSKAIIIVPGREDWNAKLWAEAYYRSVWKLWGFPQTIITDRGGQFISVFWRALFKKARTRLHTTTAYHAQGDGQSEITNQTIEIALRHVVNGRQDDWIEYLPFVESAHNNSINSSTGKSPNEILYGMNHRTALDASINVGNAPEAEAFSKTRESKRLEAAEALTFAAARMKAQYDKHHKPIDIPIGSFVHIKYSRSFEKGYAPKNTASAKLANQRGGRYQVVEKVGSLAYRLDLRGTLPGTHPVFSVEHIEPCSPPDEFGRAAVGETPVLVDGHEEWEISEIIAKAIRGHGRNRGVHYLVRWKGYDRTEDEWIPISHLQNASKIVQEFESRRLILPADKAYEAKLAKLKASRKSSDPPVVEFLTHNSTSDDKSDSEDDSPSLASHLGLEAQSTNWPPRDDSASERRKLHARKALSRPGLRGRRFGLGTGWGESYASLPLTPRRVRFNEDPVLHRGR